MQHRRGYPQVGKRIASINDSSRTRAGIIERHELQAAHALVVVLLAPDELQHLVSLPGTWTREPGWVGGGADPFERAFFKKGFILA